MKILVIIPSFAGGGAEKTFVHIAEYLQANGHEIVAITVASKKKDVYILSPKINRFDLGFENRKWYKLGMYIKIIRRIRKIAVEYKPDCVLSFLLKANILSLLALSRYPIIISERSILNRSDNSLLSKGFRRILYPKASALVVMTNAAARDIVHIVPKQKVHVIANSVRITPSLNGLDKTRESIKNLYPNPKDIEGIIVSAGRLHSVKGFDLLIKAFAQIAGQYTGWNLLILGEGNQRRALQQLINTYGLSDRISMPGRKENIHDYFRACDLYALSSRSEAFGNVLIEAMACGLPVVSFNCPYGPGEIIEHEVNGILVPELDTEKLALSLRCIINDREKRERLALAGKQYVTRFDEHKIDAQWENLLIMCGKNKERQCNAKR